MCGGKCHTSAKWVQFYSLSKVVCFGWPRPLSFSSMESCFNQMSRAGLCVLSFYIKILRYFTVHMFYSCLNLTVFYRQPGQVYSKNLFTHKLLCLLCAFTASTTTTVCVCVCGFFSAACLKYRIIPITVAVRLVMRGMVHTAQVHAALCSLTHIWFCKAYVYELTCVFMSQVMDACAKNNGGCSPNAVCKKTLPGRRQCVCNPGYSGDGQVCVCKSTICFFIYFVLFL